MAGPPPVAIPTTRNPGSRLPPLHASQVDATTLATSLVIYSRLILPFPPFRHCPATVFTNSHRPRPSRLHQTCVNKKTLASCHKFIPISRILHPCSHQQIPLVSTWLTNTYYHSHDPNSHLLRTNRHPYLITELAPSDSLLGPGSTGYHLDENGATLYNVVPVSTNNLNCVYKRNVLYCMILIDFTTPRICKSKQLN
ncbi:hypothetical protein AB3S75_047220 [Citrus x aurantiifolia]